jgi:hypothetical protein
MCIKLVMTNWLWNYLLTPYSSVLFEKPTGSQLVQKFPAFYGPRRFIPACTSSRRMPLSWVTQRNMLLLKAAHEARKWKMHCLTYRLHIVKMKNFYFKRSIIVRVPSMSFIVCPSTGKYELGKAKWVDRVSRNFFFLPVLDSSACVWCLSIIARYCVRRIVSVKQGVFISRPSARRVFVTRKCRNSCYIHAAAAVSFGRNAHRIVDIYHTTGSVLCKNIYKKRKLVFFGWCVDYSE